MPRRRLLQKLLLAQPDDRHPRAATAAGFFPREINVAGRVSSVVVITVVLLVVGAIVFKRLERAVLKEI